MTSVELVPNSTIAGGSNFTATVFPTLWQALADLTDAAYIRKTGNGQKSCVIGFSTDTIGTNRMVKQVRLRMRASTPTTSGKFDMQMGVTADGVTTYFPAFPVRGLTTTTDWVGAWQAAAPSGQAWTQALIDSLRCQVIEYKDDTHRAYLYELAVDVEYASQPTLTVDTPTGTVTDTASPTVTWTFADTDGEAQAYYEVKAFSADQYGAAGFNPDTTTPAWGSGIVSSSEPTAQIGTYLSNGSWRVYVRAAKLVNSSPYFSDWAYSAFTVSLTPPPTPTLTLTYASATGSVTAVIDGAPSVAFTYQRIQVQRSDDAGTTWSDVRYGSEVIPDGSYNVTLTDYEAVRGQTAYYRARAIGFIGTNVIASPWTTSATVSVTNDGTWWIKAMLDPNLNMGNVRILAGLEMQQEEDVAVFRPIGRTRAVVVAGALGGSDGTYGIITAGDTEWAKVYALISHQGTLLVQSPDNTQKYVRFISRGWKESGAVGHLVRDMRVSYVEVDA